jgi:hypothetical protein
MTYNSARAHMSTRCLRGCLKNGRDAFAVGHASLRFASQIAATSGTAFRRVRVREVRMKNPFCLLILILLVRTFRKKVPAFGQYSDTL